MKRIALLVIILAIVACCLFPPWQRIYKERKSNIKKFEPMGYSFIAEPASKRLYKTSLQIGYTEIKADTIDFGRLGIQIGLLLFLGSCIVFSKYIFPKTKLKPKAVSSGEPPPKKKWKWMTKTLICLLILVLVGYGLILTSLYFEAEQSSYIWYDKYYELEKKQSQSQSKAKQYQGKNSYLDALLAGDYKEVERLGALLDSERVDAMNKEKQMQRVDEADEHYTDSPGLKMDAYGLGIHQNQYGRPVTLRPDFGYVEGEQLKIKENGYGLGVHMDQYGRPVREKPWP